MTPLARLQSLRRLDGARARMGDVQRLLADGPALRMLFDARDDVTAVAELLEQSLRKTLYWRRKASRKKGRR